MAIEAYSRGFEVLGIEKNPACFKIAKENFKKVLDEGAELPLVAGDTLKILPKIEGVFDVIYLDPPWEADYGKILSIATAKLKNGGTIICESDKGDFKELAAERGLRVLKEKKYGRAILTVLTTL